MRKSVIAIAIAAGLAVSGCQTLGGYDNLGTVIGGLGGAAGGAVLGKRIGAGKGNKIARIGVPIAGAVLGGLAGRTVGKVYDNSNDVEANRGVIYRNQNRSLNNSDRIRYIQNNRGGGSAGNGGNAYNCRVRNNYVVCND